MAFHTENIYAMIYNPKKKTKKKYEEPTKKKIKSQTIAQT